MCVFLLPGESLGRDAVFPSGSENGATKVSVCLYTSVREKVEAEVMQRDSGAYVSAVLVNAC